MRYLLLLILLALSLKSTHGQYWLQNAGGTANDEALAVARDAAGNIYTTGYFTANAAFGSQIINSSGSGDVFVMKQDGSGNIVWAKKAGGSYGDRGTGIAVDGAGNVFVTGHFRGTANFGSHQLTAPSGTQHGFLTKLDANGNFIWAVQMGGTDLTIPYDVATDNSGNAIVTGQFKQQCQIGAMGYTSMLNPATMQRSFDMFIAKVSGSGAFLWSKAGFAKFDDRIIAVDVDAANNIYLVGQFSDTLMLSTVYPNTQLNAGFLLKLDELGNELWLKRFSAPLVTIYDVHCKGTDVYVTGDFKGQLGIQQGNSWHTLQGTYDNLIFAAHINGSGGILATYQHSSTNQFSSRTIGTDQAGNVYLGGHFKCSLSDYSDLYGDGLFLSVGHRDIFVTKLNNSLMFEAARHFGGPKDDYCAALVVAGINLPIIGGSFERRFNVPRGGSFSMHSSNSDSSAYGANPTLSMCGDMHYGKFASVNSLGQKDILISSPLDLSRSVYDYFLRSTCNHPILPAVLHVQDTLTTCDTINLKVNTHTGVDGIIGPLYTYLWSNGYTGNSQQVSSSGWFHVQVSTDDGCRSSDDSVYVQIFTPPVEPTVQAFGGFQEEAIPIIGCLNKVLFTIGDSVLLVGSNPGVGYTYGWNTPSGFIAGDSIYTSVGGLFHYEVALPGGHCAEHACFSVIVTDTAMCNAQCNPPTVGLFLTDYNFEVTDTVVVCFNDYFGIALSDSAILYQYGPTLIGNFGYWNISGGFIFSPFESFPVTFWLHEQKFKAQTSGNCTVEVTMNNAFTGLPQYTWTKNFYLHVVPYPPNNPAINGPPHLCLGDTVLLTVSGGDNIIWTGPGITWESAGSDSVLVNIPGQYKVESTVFEPLIGCDTTVTVAFNLSAPPGPPVTMLPVHGVICPGDSVLLGAVTGSDYVWIGPTNQPLSTTQQVYVDVPGFYHYIFTDPQGCSMVSETAEVLEYSTPYLYAEPGLVLCNGPVTLHVESLGSPLVQWQSPLSGSGLTQIVNNPGVYTVEIEFCNVLTTASIEILAPSSFAQISPIGNTTICTNDSLMLTGNQGMVGYQWSTGESDFGIIVSQPGWYYLLVEDENGCTASDSIEIFQIASPPTPLLVAEPDTVCFGSQVVLVANGNGFQVHWLNNQHSTSIIFSGDSLYLNAEMSHEYYAFVNDGVCNSALLPLNVKVNPVSAPHPIIGDTILCINESLFLEVPHFAGATYSWSFNGNLLGATNTLQIPNVNISNSGIYSIQISDSQCTGPVLLVNVTVNPLPQPIVVSTANIICVGNEALFYTTQPFESYLWLPSGQTSDSLSVTQGGAHQVTVTDQNGCIATSTAYSIYITPGPPQPIASGTAVCVGNTATLEAAGNMDIHWYLNDSLVHIGDVFTTWSLSDSLVFSVHQVDSLGCLSNPVLVSVAVVPPGIIPEFSGELEICELDNLSVSMDNAPANATVVWTHLGSTLNTGNPLEINQSTSANAGMYTAFFSLNNCYSGVGAFEVTVNAIPLDPLPNYQTQLCANESFEATLNQPEAGAVYSWVVQPSGDSSLGNSLTVYNVENLSVTLFATNGNCAYSWPLTISVLPAPEGYIPTINGCIGDTVSLSFNAINPTGYNYQWLGPNGFSSFDESPFIYPFGLNDTGSYSLLVSLGVCDQDYTFYVNAYQYPFFNLLDTVICLGDEAEYLMPPQWNYYWGDGSSGSSYATGDSGIVTVTAYDGTFCPIKDTAMVVVIDCNLQNFTNVFTPNGDGTNDVFYFYSEGYRLIHVDIFNRWGQLVNQVLKHDEGWNGKHMNGIDVPEGTYFYIVRHINYKGNEEVVKGTVTLFR